MPVTMMVTINSVLSRLYTTTFNAGKYEPPGTPHAGYGQVVGDR
jgi:hypothetical protein